MELHKTDTHLGMAVNTPREAEFFLNALHEHHTVLEWGSGASTFAIAKKVKRVCSIEHNRDWFNELIDQMPGNVHLCYVPQNSEPQPGHDGTRKEFYDYIQKAIQLADIYGKFDIIFIDGRARVACAEICHLIGHKDTQVFVHDYDHPNPKYKRTEYQPIEELHLDRLNGEFTMHRFKIKKLNNDGPF